MRKTKFRGKTKLRNEWIEGDFVTDIKEFNRSCDKAYILPYWDKLNIPIEVMPETVGQFTGLTDSNGFEIFEHDIGTHFRYQFEVVYHNGAFYGKQEGVDYFVLVSELLVDFHVIGNIHEQNIHCPKKEKNQ